MLDDIRLRLTLGYVGILTLILVAFGVVVVIIFRDATVSQHDDLLSKRAQALADAVSRGGTVRSPSAAIGAFAGTAPAGSGGRAKPPRSARADSRCSARRRSSALGASPNVPGNGLQRIRTPGI